MELHKPNLFDTQIGKQSDLKNLILEATKFLLDNYNQVVVDDRELVSLKSIKNFSNTTMAGLFDALLSYNKLTQFKCFDFSRVNKDIPEILTLSSITVDGNSFGIPGKELQKVWCNITPFIKKRTYQSEQLTFSDIDKIHELFIRGALCRSYNASTTWLTPDIASILIESYSITISNILSSAYKLAPQDSHMIVLLFAAYYAQLLNISGSMEFPELLIKCKRLNYLGVNFDSMNNINRLRDNSKVPLTVHEICKILSTSGPTRMKTFNINTLNSLFSKGITDNSVMLIALEYPPYYALQLIRLMDNYKNHVLLGNKDNKTKYAPLLVELIRTCPLFIPKL